jgi:WhiB family transcriptional regulator, redox-sensing transcriptional regulator
VTGARLRRIAEAIADAGFVAPESASWRERAACGAADPEVFFPVGDEPAAPVRVLAAQRVCAGCPVRRECLADVMAWEDPARRWGVVGGLSATQRCELFDTRRSGAGDAREVA